MDPFTLFLITTSLLSALGGAASSIKAGQAEAQAFEFQAGQAKAQARQERINAQKRANTLRQQLLEDLGSANAAFGARGITLTSGTAQAAQIASRRAAARAIKGEKDIGFIRQQAGLAQAGQFRLSAKEAKTQGLIRAGTSLLGGLGGLAR